MSMAMAAAMIRNHFVFIASFLLYIVRGARIFDYSLMEPSMTPLTKYFCRKG
jgi:hypothetical protein